MALCLASAAHALTLQLGVNITTAVAGNPVNAVVGTFNNAGTADTGTVVPAGVGIVFIPMRADQSGAGAGLSLTLGSMTFTETDDHEFTFATDVPAGTFNNGGLTGFDWFVYFEMVAGSPVAKPLDSSNLGQDTSAFLATPHFALAFDDVLNFSIAPITGFAVGVDGLDPVTGAPLVLGSVFVPEPSVTVLLATGLLVPLLRRRRA